MTQVLQVRNQTIAAENIISLLVDYQMLTQFLREVITDQAIADFPCTPEEKADACQKFYENHQLALESERQAWLEQHEISPEQIEILATRSLRIEKFQKVKWGKKLESYFLQRKGALDKVIYSLLRTTDMDLALELYFRIQEGEQSFAELARAYSQGPEAKTGGLVGPVELGKIDPHLAKKLYGIQPGQLLPPLGLEKWTFIVRLEQFIPSQLDESMRQRLLNELFETWLQEELVKLASDGSISLN